MIDKNNTAQAAEQDPLSDQFVNAVIRQHGYDSPEAVIARLWQWIGLNGSENGVTLLMYEAHKALVKLRAPVASAEVLDALNWVDDFIARCNGDDVGACESVNVLRRALANAPAPNHATSEGQNMFYEGLFEGETERQRDRRLKWMKTVRPASAPVAFYRQSLRELVDVVWNEATESTAVPDTAWADRLIDKVFPSVLASAPVADNWQQYALPGETTAEQVCERMNAEVTRRTVAAMRANAPVADEQASGRQYHVLKTDPDVFQAVLSGAKTFEIRLNDRGYAVGDALGLRETKHTGAEMQTGAPLEYTGRECLRFVSHVLTGYGLADGWCCLSFKLPHAGGASAPVADETYTDEKGTVWTRPTAWAYAQVCKARDKWQERQAPL